MHGNTFQSLNQFSSSEANKGDRHLFDWRRQGMVKGKMPIPSLVSHAPLILGYFLFEDMGIDIINIACKNSCPG